MIERWRKLRATAGTGAAWRTVILVAAFALLAVAVALDEGALLPAGGYVAGLVLPYALRRWMVARVEVASRVLHFVGLGVLVSTAVLGWARGRLWTEGVGDAWLLTGVAFVAAAYGSAFFWLYSDPEVVRLD